MSLALSNTSRLPADSSYTADTSRESSTLNGYTATPRHTATDEHAPDQQHDVDYTQPRSTAASERTFDDLESQRSAYNDKDSADGRQTKQYNRRIPPFHPVQHRRSHNRPNWFQRYVFSFYPQVFAWHFSLSWLLGSFCFVVASCGLLFQKNHVHQKTAIAYGCVALAGACLFTYGAVFQWLQVLQVPVQYDPASEHYKDIYTSSNNPSNWEAPHRTNRLGSEIMHDGQIPLWRRFNLVFNQWSRIDYQLTMAQLIGAILFNINTVVQVGWWKSVLQPGYAGGNSALYLGLNVGCDITGCCLFTIAGYLAILEQSQAKWPKPPTSVALACMYANLIGGLGFLCNAVLWLFYYQTLQQYLLFIPLLVGSLAFVVASYWFYYEQLNGLPEQ